MSAYRAVLWKDLRELVLGGGKQTIGIFVSSAVFVAAAVAQSFVIGSYTPAVLLVLFLSFLGVALTGVSLAADAVAGERERHTLETLLAMPVSGAALYWGKMSAMLMIGLGNTLAIGLGGILVVTALFGEWSKIGFALGLLPLVLLGGTLVGLLLASIGLIVSARSRTMQQAQMIMGFSMIPVMLFLFGVPALVMAGTLFAIQPTDLEGMVMGLVTGLIIGAVVVAGVIVGLVMLGLRMFARHRLMLS